MDLTEGREARCRRRNGMWRWWCGSARTGGCCRGRLSGRTAGRFPWTACWPCRLRRRSGRADREIGTRSAWADRCGIFSLSAHWERAAAVRGGGLWRRPFRGGAPDRHKKEGIIRKKMIPFLLSLFRRRSPAGGGRRRALRGKGSRRRWRDGAARRGRSPRRGAWLRSFCPRRRGEAAR